MNREEAKRLAHVIQAYAEGKAIQVCNPYIKSNNREGKLWVDITHNASFDPCMEWRIKPEARVFKVWINKNTGNVVNYRTGEANCLEEYARAGWELITVKEVVDGAD